jgi:hypothetical protein
MPSVLYVVARDRPFAPPEREVREDAPAKPRRERRPFLPLRRPAEAPDRGHPKPEPAPNPR